MMLLYTASALLLSALASSLQSCTVAAYISPPFASRRRFRISLQNSANDDVNNVNTLSYFSLDNHSTGSSRRDFFQRSSAIAIAFASTIINIGSSTSVANAALLSSSSSALPPLNTPAPNFELPNSLNNAQRPTTSLTSLLDTKKWTVLYFYPGAFTSGCTLEARNFQSDLAIYTQLNAQIVGVSVDSVEKNSDFCASEKLEYTLLTDEGGKVSKLYGSSLSIPGFGTFSNRQTYIIDPRGDVRWVFVDVDSKIPRHSGDVLEKLRELQQQQ
ncbi:hypothetical protein ACHAXM_003340 [Skeletonema potamos]